MIPRNLELKPAGGPFHDPALLVSVKNQKSSILFDCGTLFGLKTRDLMKVEWLFLSHLHIDHFIGFDHLLRVRLFSDLPLNVVGPPGTSQALFHRLQSYTWNLTSGSPFIVRALELDQHEISNFQIFPCHDRFLPSSQSVEPILDSSGALSLFDGVRLRWHPVEHGVPCNSYRLERFFSPKFSLETCKSLALEPGPWVKKLTEGGDFELEVDGTIRNSQWLSEQLLTPVPSESLGFLTDTVLNPRLHERLAVFFRGVTTLACECAYLRRDIELANQNQHMTTEQVASLAKESESEELLLFHLSRRYQESGPDEHLIETRAVFPATRLLSSD